MNLGHDSTGTAGPGAHADATPHARAGPGVATALARTAGFSVLYLAATWAGRLTVMDGTNLSMVWPAAGVAALWFLTARHPRWRRLDMLCLSAVTMAVNVATGAPTVMAVMFVLANLAQALIFAHLFRRWLPGLWGGGGDRPLSRLTHLWRLLAVSVISTVCGALIGPTAVWLVDGAYSVPAAAVWLTRNTASMLLIGAAGLRLGYLLSAYPAAGPTASSRRTALRAVWRATSWPRRAEYAAVVTVSAAAYIVAFGIDHGLPLAFPLIVMTVWAGLRLHTTFVVLHDLAFGSLAVSYTLLGLGPFAAIESYPTRALIVQLFVGIVAVVGLAVALGRDERAELLRTLRLARTTAAEQATVLRTIVDSMGEGLAVMDADGRFLMRNPAAATLLGGVTSPTGRMADSSFYGLFHTDGRPIAADEMPFRRALRTGQPQGMDMVVRNAALPAGRVLAVNATPLPEPIAGTAYALSIFHDVTAERRHRDELAAFAGVVAHDLANPLTTVEGWGEDLPELIRTAPERALDAIGRINRAAARMRTLIVDLLDYTTARDATLRTTRTDLTATATGIAAARVDQAKGVDAPVPRFTIGDLHAVHADPALIRQLLENLISNAIKYTAPGITPHITVTTSRHDDVVEVAVGDNGIGIPAGEHRAVFGNFHRAHPTAGYTGTGLGLAICERIVERHGGTITASDNPAGTGTVITFTVPAADTAADSAAAPSRSVAYAT
ncbi:MULTISPECIES: ATP-binding protein [Catenuloplanes]|uniref:Sensor-like histidine kinase SenX3 n=1 Tax=Catenuloplanes niger TaxID=587534 RepID=A0AAE3ZYK6_9ACTN|nr:ATP-binding protein [Catenuloplanes niger]MDR7327624.1 PAS domain S-box-containing protein [Catenuloplanes niger]